MMSRRFWLINLLLIFILVLLSVKVYEVWTRPNTRGLESVASKPKPVASSLSVSVGGKKETAPAKGFQSISEKNLFSPERKEFPILASPDGRKGSGRPNIVLYGVTLGEDYQAALITNPGRRPERGERETMSVKVGDKVGEYQVAKISPDRITLENEGDSFDVLLYDASQPKKRPVAPSPPIARPTPTPATPTPSPGTPPRPVTPSPGVSQPSLPPAPTSPGMSQSPLPPPAGRQPASRNLLRQRSAPVPSPVSPRTPVTPELEEEEQEVEE
jgi:type II secretory pathway component PulC